MERRSFDFGRILQQHEKKHKQKPVQFVSVASGVQKRMESRLKSRKSNRLSIFDSIRNLPTASPVPVSEAQQKLAHRLQQLERWKEEKEKKKKEAASKKKKPFLAGVPQTSHKYVPPPPPPIKPTTSGRVTRSQTARNKKSEVIMSQSFAPKNATFRPPELKNNPKVPSVSLAPLKQLKSRVTFTFDPVLPKKKDKPVAVKDVRPSRSRAQTKQIDTKVVKKKDEDKKNATNYKTFSRPTPKTVQSSSSSETDSSMSLHKTLSTSSRETDSSMSQHKTLQSSSSSESDVSLSAMERKHVTLPTTQLQYTGTEYESSSSLSNTKDKSLNQRRTRQSLKNPDSPIPLSKTPRKSTLSAPEQMTPKNQVPRSESSSEERLRPSVFPLDTERTPEEIIKEAKWISPCVTMSRGKDNARREMKKKLDKGLLDVETSDVGNIDHFRRQLASEIKRMTETCEQWDRVLEQAVLPDSIQESILAAVGQCRLLMSQKLQQFASLVERCARPEPGSALVTPADLHGFWDMVFMQIENVDIRFKKLEELRARNWTEEQVAVAAKRNVVKAVRAKPTGATSRIKDMIAAARKAQKEHIPAPTAAAEKSFEAGFFCVTSPIRSPAPATPRTKMPTLLKAVLSSEAKKSASKNSASFAMLRASVLGKNAEYDGISPLPQTPTNTNMNATPGRSILKKTTESAKMSSKKSIKVVLFDQSRTEFNKSLDDQPIETTDLTTPLDHQPIETTVLTTPLDNPPIETQEEQPMGNVDSGVFSMEIEKEEKENVEIIRKSLRLSRQGAIDIPHCSLMMTRSRRKAAATPHETPDNNNKTPQVVKKTPLENQTPQPQGKGRRSARKSKILADVLNDL